MNEITAKAAVLAAARKHLNTKGGTLQLLGQGATSCVYRFQCPEAPPLAVKYSAHAALLQEEFDVLRFLHEQAPDFRQAAPRFLETAENGAVMGMDYLPGTGADHIKLLALRPGHRRLADTITDNLIALHNVRGKAFGAYDRPAHSRWIDYYAPFAEEICTFAKAQHQAGRLQKRVADTVCAAYDCLDRIFADCSDVPALIHGDYWAPNLIVAPKTMEFLGAVDPFNVLWAEPEYELFALTLGAGKGLKLYENYKSKVPVSDTCDLKVELYALFSELLWYKKLGTISHQYLSFRAGRLQKGMKRRGWL